MDLRNWFSKAGYSILGLSSILLIISPYVDLIGKNISAHTWVGIFCGVLSAFIVYYETITTTIKTDITLQKNNLEELVIKYDELVNQRNQIRHETLSEAIRISTKNNKSIKELRVYASTTAVIFQIVRDLNLKIEECKVMLQIFNTKSANPYSAQLNKKCVEMTEAWLELKESGRIDKLSVARYDSFPTEYVIIIDNRFLITGRYTPNDSSKHGSNYFEPVLYSNLETSSKTLIDENIKWFNNIFNYYGGNTKK